MRPQLTAQQRQLALRLKSRGLSVHPAEDLARIAVSLNGRPRKTLSRREGERDELRSIIARTPALMSFWSSTIKSASCDHGSDGAELRAD